MYDSTEFTYDNGTDCSATHDEYTGRENDGGGIYYYRNRYYSTQAGGPPLNSKSHRGCPILSRSLRKGGRSIAVEERSGALGFGGLVWHR
jgi:hypothetical protein